MVAAGAGVLTAVQVASPAAACACGAPTPVADDPNGDVMVDHELAIISRQGQKEQVDMRLGVESLARDSGLIMPTPGPAVVSQGDASAFDALAAQMAPQVVTTREWWRPSFFSGGPGPSSAAAPDPGAPVVLAQVQLGPLQATTLEASDADGLTKWLDAHGYGLRDEVASLLTKYVERNWYFVAIKLTSDSALSGELDPIRFVFDTPQSGLVYPLILSQAARSAQTVNLYVFDDHRRAVGFDGGRYVEEMGADEDLTWAGPVDQESLLPYGRYLTTYMLYFDDPAQQIAGDLVFPQASDDTGYTPVVYQTEYMEFLGIPLGWWGVAVVIVAAVIVAIRPRRGHGEGVG